MDYFQTKAVLRWLCEDMILRLESETESDGFGQIDVHELKASALAIMLGFARAPIGMFIHSNDRTTYAFPRVLASLPEAFHSELPAVQDPVHTTWSGYRLYDPADYGYYEDFVTQFFGPMTEEFEVPQGFEMHDGSSGERAYCRRNPTTAQRERIARMLKLWISAIDALPRNYPELKDRFRSLCDDMIGATEASEDEDVFAREGFPNISEEIHEAAQLAVWLGRDWPPAIRFVVRPDGSCIFSVGIGTCIGEAEGPVTEYADLLSKGGQDRAIWGLRVRDPKGCVQDLGLRMGPVMLRTGILHEVPVPYQDELPAPPDDRSGAEVRAIVIKTLKLWIEAVDAMPEQAERPRAAIEGAPGTYERMVGVVEGLSAAIPEGASRTQKPKKSKKKGRRGAPCKYDPHEDLKVSREWNRVKGKLGPGRKEFAARHGLTPKEFVNLLDRVRKRQDSGD